MLHDKMKNINFHFIRNNVYYVIICHIYNVFFVFIFRITQESKGCFIGACCWDICGIFNYPFINAITCAALGDVAQHVDGLGRGHGDSADSLGRFSRMCRRSGARSAEPSPTPCGHWPYSSTNLHVGDLLTDRPDIPTRAVADLSQPIMATASACHAHVMDYG